MYKFSALLGLCLMLSCVVFSQNDSLHRKLEFVQEDFKDWMVRKGWGKPKEEKDHFLLVIPIVAANPTAGLIYGAGFTYAYKAHPSDTRLSSATSNATYSTKQILNLNIKSNFFVAHEKLVLNGDWRYMVNNETTYGLGTKRFVSNGTDLEGYDLADDSTGDPLKFITIRFHETASWELLPNFFAGLGFQYDNVYNIQESALAEGDTIRDYHYKYSTAHGFNPQKYITSGVSLNFIFDSRDNQVNAYTGYFANVNYLVNAMALGSSKNSSILLTEFRSFYPLDGARKRHILAFWLYGNFVVSGDVPYLDLPALGYDQRQRSGRGYAFGRFRGENLAYGETEYRFPISAHTGILGGVAFLNLTSTSDHQNNVNLLEYIRPGYGAGLRIMLDKKSRTRLEIDCASGNKNIGFYFGAQETF